MNIRSTLASMSLRVAFFGMIVLALALAGCVAPAAPVAPTQAPPAPTVAPAAPTTAPEPTAAPAAAGATMAASLMLAKNDQLGSFLADDQGRTLYLFTKDTPNTSNCYDQCAQAWPPLLTQGAAKAGDGVDASLLGTTTRKDGSIEVTYNGWPLYYFAKDQKPGDVTGQNVGGVWFVISAKGEKIDTSSAASASSGSGSASTPAPAGAAAGAALMLAKNDQLGSFLADDQGRTLYLFTKDTPNTSNCYDQCEQAWPPLLTQGAAKAGDGVDASLLGTTTRKDGSIQVTYNGWPLYYFAKDQKPGDVTGQDVGGVWYVISPKGDKLEAAKVMVGNNDALGQFLTDDEGRTLYLYTKDTKDTSNCYDKCAQAWPPLLTAGAPEGGDGVDAALLGTTARTDGTTQVTYSGWPLYYFVKDQKPGDVTGQNVGGVWFVISPKGEKIDTSSGASGSSGSASPASTPASGGGSGQASSQTTTISVMNFAFNPKELTISPGTTVIWHNNDSVMHTVTSDTGLFDGNLPPGGADFQFTFDKAGTYPYYCKPHGGPGGAGMSGVITVK